MSKDSTVQWDEISSHAITLTCTRSHTFLMFGGKGKTDGDGEEDMASVDRQPPAGPPNFGCFDDVAKRQDN